MTEFFTPSVLIACAAGCFGIGYLIINQMRLRTMMFIGSAFYIAYYFTAAAEPLYGAIYTTSAMMLANLAGMANLTVRRFRFSLPRQNADLYDRFDILNPGNFRLVMKSADRLVLPSPHQISTEGAEQPYLYYVISGEIDVSKRGATFSLPSGIFVGEVAYLLRRPSSASITVSMGSQVIRWNIAELRERSKRNPRFKLAIDAVLSRDLAAKVAEAFVQQPQTMARA